MTWAQAGHRWIRRRPGRSFDSEVSVCSSGEACSSSGAGRAHARQVASMTLRRRVRPATSSGMVPAEVHALVHAAHPVVADGGRIEEVEVARLQRPARGGAAIGLRAVQQKRVEHERVARGRRAPTAAGVTRQERVEVGRSRASRWRCAGRSWRRARAPAGRRAAASRAPGADSRCARRRRRAAATG